MTYAVRDGIVGHCGESDKDSIYPRKEVIDLHGITKPNQFQPFTWEGCVVKVADKIAFLGRDIEDAVRLDILPYKEFLVECAKLIPYLVDDQGPDVFSGDDYVAQNHKGDGDHDTYDEQHLDDILARLIVDEASQFPNHYGSSYDHEKASSDGFRPHNVAFMRCSHSDRNRYGEHTQYQYGRE